MLLLLSVYAIKYQYLCCEKYVSVSGIKKFKTQVKKLCR